METKKVLLIAGGVVAGCLVVAAGISAYGMYWFFGAGEQASTEVVISERSMGYARWVAAEDDPGINATLTKIAEAADQAQRSQQQKEMPAPLRSLMDLQRGQSVQSLKMFFPRSLTASFEPSDDGAEHVVLAFNPRGMGGMVKAFFKLAAMDEKAKAISHREHPILQDIAESRFAGTVHGSTILVASQLEDLKATIDRIVDERTSQPPMELVTLEKIIAPGSDFYWVHDHPFEIDALVGVAFDVETADQWRGVALVRAASPEELEAAAQQTSLMIDDARTKLAQRGAELETVRSDMDPRTARFEVRLTHVATLLDQALVP